MTQMYADVFPEAGPWHDEGAIIGVSRDVVTTLTIPLFICANLRHLQINNLRNPVS